MKGKVTGYVFEAFVFYVFTKTRKRKYEKFGTQDYNIKMNTKSAQNAFRICLGMVDVRTNFKIKNNHKL